LFDYTTVYVRNKVFFVKLHGNLSGDAKQANVILSEAKELCPPLVSCRVWLSPRTEDSSLRSE